MIDATSEQIFSQIEGGLNSFTRLLTDEIDDFVGETVNEFIEPGVDDFFDALQAEVATAVHVIQNKLLGRPTYRKYLAAHKANEKK